MPVFRLLKQAPITVGLSWLACVLFMGVCFETGDGENAHPKAQSHWGAAMEMDMWVTDHPDQPMTKLPGFRGVTDVWDGEWWRLLVNNLHHTSLISGLNDRGFLHLMMNATALLICGRIIEPRMSSMIYLIFIISSAFVVAAATGLAGEFGVGLSGVLYAYVGLLFVWRDHDESVAEAFPMPMVIFAGSWLLICQAMTYLDISHVANVAHYAGFVYGWIWGQVYLEKQQKELFRFLFGVGHVLLIPAFWFIMHPFWIGSWHWYLAHGENVPERERMERLQTALLLEPQLTDTWYELSEIYERTGDRRLALRVTMEGLKNNRTSDRLLNRVVDLWVADVKQSQNPIGSDLIAQVFDEEVEVWEKKLASRVEQSLNRLAWEPDDLTRLMERETNVKSSHDFSNLIKRPEPSRPDNFDPNDPNSASEGVLF